MIVSIFKADSFYFFFFEITAKSSYVSNLTSKIFIFFILETPSLYESKLVFVVAHHKNLAYFIF